MTREQRAKLDALRRVWMHPAQDLDRTELGALLYLADTAPAMVLDWTQRYALDRLVWRYRRQLVKQLGQYPLGFELPTAAPDWNAYRAGARHRRQARAVQDRLL